jgi:hypothetical protein
VFIMHDTLLSVVIDCPRPTPRIWFCDMCSNKSVREIDVEVFDWHVTMKMIGLFEGKFEYRKVDLRFIFTLLDRLTLLQRRFSASCSRTD